MYPPPPPFIPSLAIPLPSSSVVVPEELEVRDHLPVRAVKRRLVLVRHPELLARPLDLRLDVRVVRVADGREEVVLDLVVEAACVAKWGVREGWKGGGRGGVGRVPEKWFQKTAEREQPGDQFTDVCACTAAQSFSGMRGAALPSAACVSSIGVVPAHVAGFFASPTAPGVFFCANATPSMTWFTMNIVASISPHTRCPATNRSRPRETPWK